MCGYNHILVFYILMLAEGFKILFGLALFSFKRMHDFGITLLLLYNYFHYIYTYTYIHT